MKRLFIAVALLAASVLLSVLGYMDLKTKGGELVKSFNETADIFKEQSEIKSGDIDGSLEATLKLWKKYKTRFEVYINHDELDDIQDATIELEQYLKEDRKTEVDELCLDCVSKLEHIIDSETPSLGEIL